MNTMSSRMTPEQYIQNIVGCGNEPLENSVVEPRLMQGEENPCALMGNPVAGSLFEQLNSALAPNSAAASPELNTEYDITTPQGPQLS